MTQSNLQHALHSGCHVRYVNQEGQEVDGVAHVVLRRAGMIKCAGTGEIINFSQVRSFRDQHQVPSVQTNLQVAYAAGGE